MATSIRRAAVAGCALLLLLTFGAGCAGNEPVHTERRDLASASPLAEFLGLPARSHRGLPLIDDAEAQRQDELTGLVAECMDEAGFDYQVVPLAERLGEELLAAYTLEPREFAERYGYGATTLSAAEFDDPNQQLREALPPDEQTAYDEALWGDPVTGGGCYLAASAEVYGDPAARESGYAAFEELIWQIHELSSQIDADPRLAEAHQRWAGCLAEAGYPGFQQPADARRSVHEQLPGLPPSPDLPVPPPTPPTPADPQQWSEAQAYELALAPIDLDCQQRHVLGVRREVTMTLEQEFLDDHRAELTRYRDWLADPD